MERWCTTFLMLLFCQFGFSAIHQQELIFQNCTKESLKKTSPQDRDSARINCIEKKWPAHYTFSKCVQESRKFEYLMNEESSLKSCYHTKPKYFNIKNCLTVANQLHSISERDDMRLHCAAANGAPRNKNVCFKVAKSLEQSQLIKKFNLSCLEN